MSEGCGLSLSVGPSGTYTIVQNQVALSQDWANQAFETALSFLSELQEFKLDQVNVSSNFEVDASYTPFDKPEAPEAPELEFSLVEPLPTAPTLDDPDTPTLADQPVFDGVRPDIQVPSAPVMDTLPDLPVKPATGGQVAPEEITVELPELPTLEQLTLPAVPDVDMSELKAAFDVTRGEKPVVGDDLLNGLRNDFAADVDGSRAAIFDISEANLEQINLNYGLWETGPNGVVQKTATKVGTLLDGGTGLPAAIEEAIFQRASEREDRTALQAEQTALEDHSRRGFELPNGVLLARLDEVRQQNASAKRKFLRDVKIRNQDLEIENLRFAVQQGIAQEDQAFRHFVELFGRSQDVATKAWEVGKSIFDAKLTLRELQLRTWQADLESFRTWIAVELSDLEVYKAQLEGQALVSQINAQTVEVYKSRLQGLLVRVDIYKAQVDAFEALVQTDNVKLQGYKTEIDAYGELVRARDSEFKAYGTAVEAEVSKVNLYEAESRAFAERMRGWSAGTNAQYEAERLKIQQNELRIREFGAKLEAYSAQIRAEAERITAGSRVFDGQSRLYTAEVGVEQARASADTRRFQLELDKGRTEAQLRIQKAQTDIAQIQREAQLTLESLSAGGRVASQLAGSAMSAVNIGASISGSSSESSSTSCSTTYSFEG